MLLDFALAAVRVDFTDGAALPVVMIEASPAVLMDAKEATLWGDRASCVVPVGEPTTDEGVDSPTRVRVGIAAGDAAAANTGVDDGLVSGEAAAVAVPVLLPPHGRHATNFPNADGARDELCPLSVSLPLLCAGPDTTLPPGWRGRVCEIRSRKITLPRFPPGLLLNSVG